MAREIWTLIKTGDKVLLTPKPTAPPSSPIPAVFDGVKAMSTGVIATVVVLRNGKTECYSMSLYELRKDNG